MKIKIDTKELLKGLKEIKKTVAKTTDILYSQTKGFVKVTSHKHHGLTIESTDSTGQIKYTFDSDLYSVDSFESFGVEPKMLEKILKTLKGTPTTLDFDKEKGMLEVINGTSNFKIETFKGALIYYESKNPTSEFTISKDDFIRVFGSVVESISKLEARPLLTSVHLWSDSSNTIKVVATDSHRLTMNSFDTPTKINKKINLNLNGSMIEKIIKDKRNLSGDLTVTLFGHYAKISSNKKEYCVEFVQGAYPDTDRLIPTDSDTTLTVDENEIAPKIASAEIVAENRRDYAVLLTIDDSKALVHANSDDTSDMDLSYSSELKSTHSGDELTIGFNPDYMLSALKSLKDSRVTLDFTGALRPFTIKTDKDDRLIELVTPIRIFEY